LQRLWYVAHDPEVARQFVGFVEDLVVGEMFREERVIRIVFLRVLGKDDGLNMISSM
jgi:hypothetical protein